MKVLVLSQHYWPETFRINEVVESLRDIGCDVTVLTGQPNYPGGSVLAGYRATGWGSQRHPSGYTIHRVPLVPRGNGSAKRLVANYLSFIASACLLGPWLLRRQRFDVVFVYGTSPILQAIPAIVIKRLKGARLVLWVQDLWPQSLEVTGHVRNPRVLNAVASVVRWIYRRSDLLLGQSRAFVDALRPMAGSTPVEAHPNPGDKAVPLHDHGTAQPVLTLDKAFNVVFAGNLGTVQALDTILDAAQLLQSHGDLRWVFVGDGTRSAWLSEEVARRRLTNVRLAGRFPSAAMPGIFAQASALLVSLTRDPAMERTVPSKVQAYLAAGRPIIAALDGEGAEVVREAGAGVCCRAGDATALAEAVLSLRAASPERLQEMSNAGRDYHRRHYAPELLAMRLKKRLEDLVAADPS